jgi:hypothetical protein
MTDRHDEGVSLRRRHVLLAGSAGALAPALTPTLTFAAADQAALQRNPFGGGRLVLSGCVRDANAAPLAATRVAIRDAGATLGFATTDADGRFVLEARAPAAAARLALQVGGARPRALRFTRAGTPRVEGLAQIERDAAGVWRAAVGLTVA